MKEASEMTSKELCEYEMTMLTDAEIVEYECMPVTYEVLFAVFFEIAYNSDAVAWLRVDARRACREIAGVLV